MSKIEIQRYAAQRKPTEMPYHDGPWVKYNDVAQLLEELARLRAANVVHTGMEDAPRDRPFLVWHGKYCEWITCERNSKYFSAWDSEEALNEDRLTHWRELPPPPEEPESGETEG